MNGAHYPLNLLLNKTILQTHSPANHLHFSEQLNLLLLPPHLWVRPPSYFWCSLLQWLNLRFRFFINQVTHQRGGWGGGENRNLKWITRSRPEWRLNWPPTTQERSRGARPSQIVHPWIINVRQRVLCLFAGKEDTCSALSVDFGCHLRGRLRSCHQGGIGVFNLSPLHFDATTDAKNNRNSYTRTE